MSWIPKNEFFVKRAINEFWGGNGWSDSDIEEAGSSGKDLDEAYVKSKILEPHGLTGNGARKEDLEDVYNYLNDSQNESFWTSTETANKRRAGYKAYAKGVRSYIDKYYNAQGDRIDPAAEKAKEDAEKKRIADEMNAAGLDRTGTSSGQQQPQQQTQQQPKQDYARPDVNFNDPEQYRQQVYNYASVRSGGGTPSETELANAHSYFQSFNPYNQGYTAWQTGQQSGQQQAGQQQAGQQQPQQQTQQQPATQTSQYTGNYPTAPIQQLGTPAQNQKPGQQPGQAAWAANRQGMQKSSADKARDKRFLFAADRGDHQAFEADVRWNKMR